MSIIQLKFVNPGGSGFSFFKLNNQFEWWARHTFVSLLSFFASKKIIHVCLVPVNQWPFQKQQS